MNPRPALVAAVLLALSRVPASAQTKVVEPVGGGSGIAPTINTTPNLGTNVTPGLNTTNLGVNTNLPGVGGTNVVPTATTKGAASVQPTGYAPGSTAVTPNGRAQGATNQQGFSANKQAATLSQTSNSISERSTAPQGSHAQATRTQTTTPITAAPTGGALGGAVTDIKKAEELDAAGDGLGVATALKKVFDASLGGGRSLQQNGSAPSSVKGKTMDAAGKIMQTAANAEQAAPQEAAEHYKTAVQQAVDAGLSKAASTIVAYARARAQSALSKMATDAYKAAALGSSSSTGAREVKRALKGFDSWEALLGKPGAPLVKNAERLKSDVARFQAEASKPGAKPEAPEIRFEKEGASFNAVLPRGAVVSIPAGLAAQLELKGDPTSSLLGTQVDAMIAEFLQTRSGSGQAFSSKQDAERSLIPSPSIAQTVRGWLDAVARFFQRILAMLTGRAADPIAALRRAPTADEAKAAASVSGSIALDLSRLNAPYLEAMRLLGEAAPSAAQGRAALAAAKTLAAEHAKLSGDSTGVSEVAALEGRIGQDKPSSVDVRVLSFLVERLHSSAMGAALTPLAEKASGPVVFYDLTPGSGMVGVISMNLDGKRLSRAGFDVRGALAVFGPGGSREELASALAAAGGASVEAPVSAPKALAEAVAFASSKPSESEAVAAQIQSELSVSRSLAFEALGRVAHDGGSLLVTRGVRKKGKGVEELYLLTQPGTGRVFGFKAAAH